MTYRDSAVAIYILYFFLSNTILYRFETMCYWCSMFFMWNWIFFLYLHRYTAQYFIKFESLSNQSDGSFLLRTFEIVHNAWNDFEPTVLTMLCLQLCWASSYEKNRISFLRTLVECDWNKPKKKKKPERRCLTYLLLSFADCALNIASVTRNNGECCVRNQHWFE